MSMTKADVEATGKPRYAKWARVPDDLKTKTQWRGEGMRPRLDAEPAAYMWGPRNNTHYALYASESVCPVKTPRAPKARPLTPENIGAALYEINKTAKRRRDAAAFAYVSGRHGMARARKSQKESLYELKEQVLAKAEAEGIAVRVGYHLKFDEFKTREWRSNDEIGPQGEMLDSFCDDEFGASNPRARCVTITRTRETKLVCFELGGFRFHSLMDRWPTDLDAEVTDLGEWMSAATARPRIMTLKDAKATLRAYLHGTAIAPCACSQTGTGE